MTNEEIIAFLKVHLQSIQENDTQTYNATTADDLTLYEWWITPHRIDGLPFHEFMMTSNAERGTVFGAEVKGKTTTRFDLSNLHIQNYGETVIASYTLLISTASPEGVKVVQALRRYLGSRNILYGGTDAGEAQGLYDLASRRGDLPLMLASAIVIGEHGPQRLRTMEFLRSDTIAFGGEVVAEDSFIGVVHDLNLLVSLGIHVVVVHPVGEGGDGVHEVGRPGRVGRDVAQPRLMDRRHRVRFRLWRSAVRNMATHRLAETPP